MRSESSQRVGRHANDVDVLPKVIGPQGGNEPRGPVSRQNMIRSGDVVTHAGRRPLPHEDSARTLHGSEQPERIGIWHHELQMLGRHGVRHGHGLLGPIHKTRDAGHCERGLQVGTPAGRCHDAVHLGRHGRRGNRCPRSRATPIRPVRVRLGRPGRSLRTPVSPPEPATTTISEGPANADATPTTPET